MTNIGKAIGDVEERHEWVEAGTFKYGTTTYTLERNDADNGGGRPVRFAYRLTGPRGAQYGLMRNVNTPSSLFAVNMRSFLGSTPFEWFTDRTGTLEVIR